MQEGTACKKELHAIMGRSAACLEGDCRSHVGENVWVSDGWRVQLGRR